MIIRRKFSLLICDMAGTIIQENGIVYKALASSLEKVGCSIDGAMMKNWKGMGKKQVITDTIQKYNASHSLIHEAEDHFKNELKNMYFESDEICLVDSGIPDYFNDLQMQGVKIGLNTGYSKDIQDLLIKKFNLDECINSYVSSYDVKHSRPYPAMIHKLMDINGVCKAQSVIKVGDTLTDIWEAENAGCELAVGVLSGACSRDDFTKVSNTLGIKCLIADKITNVKFEIPSDFLL